MKRFLGPGILALSTTLFAQGVLAQIPVPPPSRPPSTVPTPDPTPISNPAPTAPVRRVLPPQPAPVPGAQPLRVPAQEPRTPAPNPATPSRSDASVRPTQAAPLEMAAPPLPPAVLGMPAIEPPPGTETLLGGQSISLQTALYGALLNNPTLAGVRNNATAPTPESVEVARRFPTALNPTLWIDYRPITLIPRDPFTVNGSKNTQGPFYHWGQQYLYVSLRQPLELGHQTTHRYHIAKAAFDQYQWNVVQAEYQTMVQTYNLFQTAAYRREKYRLAEQLAAFNERLQGSLKRQVEANLVPTADLILAEIESEATQQQATAARQDYLTALNVLQIQMGVPEASGMVEPLGEFTLPATVPMVDEQQMVETALQCRPAVHAAQAQVRGADAAIRLARGDRIPTPVVGPQYAMDEGGLQYVGLVYITPVPILNSGTPLVRQREAEARRARQALQQTQQQVISEVRSAVAKWNGAVELMKESAGLTSKLSKRVGDLEKLFEAGQTPLANLMQARQRLIQLENAQLDATWQATQAQADLLMALGAPSLLNVLLTQAETDAGVPNQSDQAPPAPNAAAPPPFQPTPETP